MGLSFFQDCSRLPVLKELEPRNPINIPPKAALEGSLTAYRNLYRTTLEETQ